MEIDKQVIDGIAKSVFVAQQTMDKIHQNVEGGSADWEAVGKPLVLACKVLADSVLLLVQSMGGTAE